MTRARSRVGPQTTKQAPHLDVDALLDDRNVGIIVCCGSGGVGKTTISASLALRAAERGRKVVVLTIDPARRLAQAMGIEHLDNTPRPVAGLRWQDGFGGGGAPLLDEDAGGSKGGGAPHLDEDAGGSKGGGAPHLDEDAGGSKGGGAPLLDAMMLDMKRTFDEVVESQATPEKARQILDNPFYQALSSSFAGTQEYMAMEKLGQIHRDARVGDPAGTYDLIVVDTPPSRSALDFLDAPERLASFLDGRFIRLLLAPARGPARMMTAGLGIVTGALTKVLGAQVLRDVQTFVAAFDTLFGGFRQRAQQTFQLLQAEETAFLVVAAPEPDALREAAYFVERLSEDGMPLAGLVVNRATAGHGGAADELTAEEALAAAGRLGREDPDALAVGLLRLYADRSRMVEREATLRARFTAAHPQVATAVVPALAGDVNDLDDLRRVGVLLGGQDPDTMREVSAAG